MTMEKIKLILKRLPLRGTVAALLCGAMVISFIASLAMTKPNTVFLNVGVAPFSGGFSPLTDLSEGNKVLYKQLYSTLITADPDGKMTVSDDDSTVAKSFRIYSAAEDLSEDENGGYTAFEFTLKNGITFSNGTALTADDVLFSLYLFFDPVSGNESLADMTPVGTSAYRYQRPDFARYENIAREIFSLGTDYVPTDEDSFSEDEAKLFWECFDGAAEEFCRSITEYVKENYCTAASLSNYVIEGFDPAEMENEGMLVAYSMMLWNYATLVYSYVPDENGVYVGSDNGDGTYFYKTTLEKAMESDTYVDYRESDGGSYRYDRKTSSYVTAEEDYGGKRYEKILSPEYEVISRSALSGLRDASGTFYSLTGDSFPTVSDLAFLMIRSYSEDGVIDIDSLEKNEAVDGKDNILENSVTDFSVRMAKEAPVDSVSGITQGVTESEGETFSTVTLLLEGNRSDGVFKLAVPIFSKAHLTEGFTVPDGTPVCFGVPLASEEFKAHVGERFLSPVGSGPYVLEGYEGEGVDAVTLIPRESFRTADGSSAECIRLLEIEEELKTEAVNDGTVDICLIPMTDGEASGLDGSVTKLTLCHASYDCIVVNPAYYLNMNERKALFSLFDSGGRVDTFLPPFMGENEAQMSREAGYDPTLDTARYYFEAAGYKTDENGNMSAPGGGIASFTFYLTSAEKNSPTAAIFEKAREHLVTLGGKCEIRYSDTLLSDITSSSGLPIFSIGWSVSPSGDLFNRYALSSNSDSVRAVGIRALYTNGLISAFGTVETTDEDGNGVSLTESDAAALADVILTKEKNTSDPEEKKQYRAHAAEILSKLVFELPVGQRSSVIAMSDRIDSETVKTDLTDFRSVSDVIYKLRLAE